MPRINNFIPHLFEEHQYAIIDQVLAPDLPESWGLIPLVPEGLEKEAEAKLLPALLPLNPLSPELKTECFSALKAAYAADEPLPIQTLLKSEADVQTLKNHMENHLVMHAASGKRALLRSYDPRVWVHLQWILSAEQQQELYGPISTWSIFLPFHYEQWLSYDTPKVDDAPFTPSAQPLSYSNATYQSIFRLETINRVFKQHLKPPLEALDDTARQLHDLMVQAEHDGLQRQDEQQCFVEQALQYGTNFHEHFIIQDLLKAYDREEQTYVDASALISPEQWATIQRAQSHRLHENPADQ